MKITFLGTASAHPTSDRNHSGLILDIGPESFLFDCGENIQRQIRIAGISPMKISKIFITHWHGDHVIGLVGLVQSMDLNSRKTPLDIYGPDGSAQNFHLIRKAFNINTGFKIEVHDVKSNKAFETDDYEVLAQKAKHTIPCLAFAFVEKERVRVNKDKIEKLDIKGPIVGELARGKDITVDGKTIKAKDFTFVQPGKKLTYIIDAVYDEKLVEFAKDSDILVCEGTFAKDMQLDAKRKGHMTAQQAGKIAAKSKSKQLIITHFSQRYRDPSQLQN
ncbi:MAG: ribonuclease Z, partial [archaeon]